MPTQTTNETVDEMAIEWLEQNGEDFNTFTLRDMLKVYCAGYSRRGRDTHAELMEILNQSRRPNIVAYYQRIHGGLLELADKYAPANGVSPSAGQQADHSL